MANAASYKNDETGGHAMTLGEMRALGIGHLWISCINRVCQHDALLDVSIHPAGVPILSLRHHMRCEKCGSRNMGVRPHWNERSPRPTLTIAD
jgi:hypothetical protein